MWIRSGALSSLAASEKIRTSTVLWVTESTIWKQSSCSGKVQLILIMRSRPPYQRSYIRGLHINPLKIYVFFFKHSNAFPKFLELCFGFKAIMIRLSWWGKNLNPLCFCFYLFSVRFSRCTITEFSLPSHLICSIESMVPAVKINNCLWHVPSPIKYLYTYKNIYL